MCALSLALLNCIRKQQKPTLGAGHVTCNMYPIKHCCTFMFLRSIAHACHLQPQVSAADNSTFPSWKQRNVQLAQSIEELLDGDKPSVNELKRSAGAFRFARSCAIPFERSMCVDCSLQRYGCYDSFLHA